MGVAHHASYLGWFEVARVEAFDQLGGAYSAFEADGFFMPVLSASIQFRRPAFFDDLLIINLRMLQRPKAKFSFSYEVSRAGTDILLAIGETSHGFMDANGTGIRPPPRFIELIDAAWQDDHEL